MASSTTTKPFPKIQPGGSLLLAWQLRDKHVLVIGGGDVAAGRILNCLNADARITVLCPRAGLSADVQHRLDTLPRDRIVHRDKLFAPHDLDLAFGATEEEADGQHGSNHEVDTNHPTDHSDSNYLTNPILSTNTPALVLCAIDDPLASSAVYTACRRRRIPANIADVPPECDFFFGSTLRQGPLQVMVSTNGRGPRMAALVRRQIARALPPNVGAAVERVGVLRQRLRANVAPLPHQGKQRMGWMSRVCNAWSLEDLCRLTERDIDVLLACFERDEVPLANQILGSSEQQQQQQQQEHYNSEFTFDGSFGWSI